VGNRLVKQSAMLSCEQICVIVMIPAATDQRSDDKQWKNVSCSKQTPHVLYSFLHFHYHKIRMLVHPLE
jgi:hypothetical protein